MKKIGIVGGIGWPATIEYYAGISRLSERRHRSENGRGPAPMPEIAIESLDLCKAWEYIGVSGDEASWARFDDYHRGALRRIQASGADFAVIASNTSHHRFAEITRDIDLPVINLFDVVAQECDRVGATQVMLMGTATTMRSAVLRRSFAERNIEVAEPPGSEARAAISDIIESLQRGASSPAADRLDEVVRQAGAPRFQTLPVVCLACTELPLAFPEFADLPVFERKGITYINSTAAHIAAAFDFATGEKTRRSRSGDRGGRHEH